jgi:hypothetical protein
MDGSSSISSIDEEDVKLDSSDSSSEDVSTCLLFF